MKRLSQLDLILANVKDNWFLSLDDASNLSPRDNVALTLCNEACEGGDGDGLAIGSGKIDVEERLWQGEGQKWGEGWVDGQNEFDTLRLCGILSPWSAKLFNVLGLVISSAKMTICCPSIPPLGQSFSEVEELHFLP